MLDPTPKNCLELAASYPKQDFKQIKTALELAEKAHQGQKRLSGKPYLSHPIATAMKLMEMNLQVEVIIAGLLHDVPEDTDFTLKQVREQFGPQVARIVDGVTKLGKVKYRGIERYAKNLRKMFLAMAKDPRVILVRFADRLHNLSELDYQPPNKQKRTALEVLEIYVPIAHRLGMGVLRREMEELAFQYAYPAAYKQIKKYTDKKISEYNRTQKAMNNRMIEFIKEAGINLIDLNVKPKSCYAIFKQLPRVNNDMDQVRDIIRTIYVVDSYIECYSLLGIIHSIHQPIRGNIRDFMKPPSPQGFRGLRTLIQVPDNHLSEIRIRTKEMEEKRKYGIIMKWQRGVASDPETDAKWLKELAEIQNEVSDYRDFFTKLEQLKGDIFQRRILVFTPAGEVVNLPEFSNPVDFAYAIHSEVGNKFLAANVNGREAKLDQKLKDGDIVEIIVSKKKTCPDRCWLKLVKTHKAKTQIKAALNRDDSTSSLPENFFEMKHPPVQMRD